MFLPSTAAGAWNWSSTPIWCIGGDGVELHLHSSLRLQGVMTKLMCDCTLTSVWTEAWFSKL
jgi:hypothetical protein